MEIGKLFRGASYMAVIAAALAGSGCGRNSDSKKSEHHLDLQLGEEVQIQRDDGSTVTIIEKSGGAY